MSEAQNRAKNDKYLLRLPDGMRERLKSAAADNNRSINSEILQRLEVEADAMDKQAGDQIKIRVPDGLREYLQSQAQNSGRSVNAEIVHRIYETMKISAPSEKHPLFVLQQALETLPFAAMMKFCAHLQSIVDDQYQYSKGDIGEHMMAFFKPALADPRVLPRIDPDSCLPSQDRNRI